jgi:hypothetical protein
VVSIIGFSCFGSLIILICVECEGVGNCVSGVYFECVYRN